MHFAIFSKSVGLVFERLSYAHSFGSNIQENSIIVKYYYKLKNCLHIF